MFTSSTTTPHMNCVIILKLLINIHKNMIFLFFDIILKLLYSSISGAIWILTWLNGARLGSNSLSSSITNSDLIKLESSWIFLNSTRCELVFLKKNEKNIFMCLLIGCRTENLNNRVDFGSDYFRIIIYLETIQIRLDVIHFASKSDEK